MIVTVDPKAIKVIILKFLSSFPQKSMHFFEGNYY